MKLSCTQMMLGERPLAGAFAMAAESGFDGYDGFLGFECAGTFDVEQLRRSVQWTRDHEGDAGA
jgi:hypothetical protein